MLERERAEPEPDLGLRGVGHDAEPDAFPAAEELLVEAAERHSVKDLGTAVAYWRGAVEREAGVDPEERLYERRNLHVSPLLDGMVRLDGDLDPASGEALLAALGAFRDAEARSGGDEPDPRTPAQRRADALGALARSFLDRSDRPVVGGERPHLTVTVSLEALRSGLGVARGEHGTALPASVVRRLACQARIIPAVLGSASEPLDLGRMTPVVSPALRRAVVLRDRGCRFPGCGRAPRWCDAHHVHHWADGGPTCLDNLVLLCRRHHRLVHRSFDARMVNGEPTRYALRISSKHGRRSCRRTRASHASLHRRLHTSRRPRALR